MALITSITPNFTGGVSQQPAALRFPNQAQEQINAMGSITEGLRKRPPTTHIATMDGIDAGDELYWHTINRDATERYFIAVQATASSAYISIVDYQGTTKIVDAADGDTAWVHPGAMADLAYLFTDNPKEDIEALSLADYTIVLNKSIQPKMHSATTDARNNEALIFVKAGNYDTEYIVTYTKHGGTDKGYVKFVTPDASNADHGEFIKTSFIAMALHHGLTESGALSGDYTDVGSGMALTRDVIGGGTIPFPLTNINHTVEGSTIWIQQDNSNDFEIKVDDSVGSTYLGVVKNEVQSFTDLPTVAPNGYKVKINGLPELGEIGYYAAFNTLVGTGTGAPGSASFDFKLNQIVTKSTVILKEACSIKMVLRSN